MHNRMTLTGMPPFGDRLPVLSIALLLAAVIIAAPVAALALPGENYFTYVYNEWGTTAAAPAGYTPVKALYGADMGCGPLKSPRDLFYDAQAGELYIADSGNNRVVVLDSACRFLREYASFRQGQEHQSLNNPGGIFVGADGRLYICDTGNRRVLLCTREGEVLAAFGLPESDLMDPGLDYRPEKIVVDSAGRMYVQAAGVFDGLICMDSRGAFVQFFGANRVEMTAAMMVEYLWKQILSREQRSRMASFIPIEYSNVFMDDDGFIYATAVHSANSTGEIKKLNALGVNVLHIAPLSQSQYPRDDYGDHPVAYIDNNPVDSMFADVTVDANKIITALDAKRGRVFQYDSESNLITVFGGIGEQLGTFQEPASLAAVGDSLVVLDSKKNSMTVFQRTDFGSLLHTAIGLYNGGYDLEAMGPWREVLKACANYNLAYIGLGKASYRLGDYAQAMEYFRLGHDRQGYSDALKKRTVAFGRGNLHWILLGALGLWLLVRLARLRLLPRLARWRWPDRLGLNTALRAAVHPILSMEEVKYQGRGSLTAALAVVLLSFAAAVANRQWTGFLFNPNKPDAIHIGMLFLSTAGLYALFVTANLSVTTFMGGEGKPAQVMVASAYALQPYVYLTLALTLLSRFLTLETGVFLVFGRVGAVAWSAVLMVMSLMTVHQFTFKRTLANLMATVLGMLVIVFLIALIVSLFQQIYVFAFTMFNEIIFRL